MLDEMDIALDHDRKSWAMSEGMADLVCTQLPGLQVTNHKAAPPGWYFVLLEHLITDWSASPAS